MSAIDECKQEKNSVLNTHNETRGFQVERGRAVDSPLGQLDPSRITHMVVDQAGLGASAEHCSSSGFIAGPPQQHWTCSSPAAAPIMSTLSRVMDGCGQMQPRMGTPTNAMHMQQGTISSPSIGSAPMTPQHMVQHQQQAMVQGQQTPTGQFDQTGRFAQHQQGYLQGVPESPGSVQQQKVMNGSGGQPDNSSGMVHTRQQMMIGQQQQIINLQQQQQMMSQQQPIIGQQMMVPQQMTMMDASSQQYYAQQNPQAQWTQQQQMQQTQFVRQPQMIGPQVGQRVMVQRVLYPSGPGILLRNNRLNFPNNFRRHAKWLAEI
ncbi:hypothetical protein RB195_002080 [Necator americanus]|uniref:Uncharacterized protein n=1 Tax=Necator americanus TaxID=51031 RepID=A0ABR1DHA3_NECAM